MIVVILDVFTYEQVYINWFLTLQQVKQGIAPCSLLPLCLNRSRDCVCSCHAAQSRAIRGSSPQGAPELYAAARFQHLLRLALFVLYHETAPLQMTGDDDPLSIGHDFD
jgi:hypothetical protein